MTTLVRLSLAFPPSLEAAITEVLIAAPELPGFTLFNAEGHSSDFSSASTAERIRGRIDQRVLWMIVEQGSYQQVLALLRATIGATHVRWWLEPVLDMGPMYGCSFQDLDGHVWEIMYMDQAAMAEGATPEAANA